MRVHPQPPHEETQKIYDATYFQRGQKYGLENKQTHTDTHDHALEERAKMTLLLRWGPPGRLLDVGCATGGFLHEARLAGCSILGVEPSPFAADMASRRLGIPLAPCTLSEAQLPSNHCDWITLWDVLEHLHDPVATVAETFRILKPGGLLLFSTGDAGSLWARLTGRFWPLLTPPQHLYYFTRHSVSLLLTQEGFTVETITTLAKKPTLNLILLKARESFGPLVIPFQWLANTRPLMTRRVPLNLGDIMMVVCRKPKPNPQTPTAPTEGGG